MMGLSYDTVSRTTAEGLPGPTSSSPCQDMRARPPTTANHALLTAKPVNKAVRRLTQGAAILAAAGLVSLGALLTWITYPSLNCPEKTQSDGWRATQILSSLGGDREGRSWLARVGYRPRVCFGQIEDGVVRTDGVFVLRDDWDAEANAARLGHLLVHQVEGPPLSDDAAQNSQTPCSQLVSDALDAEARAYAVELRLRRALGLEAVAAHARDYWKAPEPQRLQLVREYLESAPDRPPLKEQYLGRCLSLRGEAREQFQNAAKRGSPGP